MNRIGRRRKAIRESVSGDSLYCIFRGLLEFMAFMGMKMGLLTRWGMRNLTLVCPHCRMLPTAPVFKRGRYLLGEQELTCEACNQTSFVTLWRFEGSGHQEKASAFAARYEDGPRPPTPLTAVDLQFASRGTGPER